MNDVFPADYFAARDAFCRRAERATCRLERVSITALGPGGEALSIDIATLGGASARRTVVVTSGLHGVEGFFGSAVQQAWLDEQADRLPDGCAVVLVHALNPYGFAWVRRVNEHNVDLNRNFLLPGQEYAGAPAGYGPLDRFLNPKHSPRRIDPFRLGAGLLILRYGLQTLKDAVAIGQYEFPKGLFFGGRDVEETARIVQREFLRWAGAAEEIVHLDLHSGLGRFGTHQLLSVEPPQAQSFKALRQYFGGAVESLANSVAFAARGPMTAWLTRTLADRRYVALAPEFGTLPVTTVLAALRAENQAHFFARPTDSCYVHAKKRLLAAFCPASDAWRKRIVADGIHIINQALKYSPDQAGRCV